MTTKTVLWIKADTNDADYITSENKVCGNDLEVVRKVCDVIKKKGGQWETGDIGSSRHLYEDELTEEETEIFSDYVPYGEYGIHTIERVELRKIEVLEKFI